MMDEELHYFTHKARAEYDMSEILRVGVNQEVRQVFDQYKKDDDNLFQDYLVDPIAFAEAYNAKLHDAFGYEPLLLKRPSCNNKDHKNNDDNNRNEEISGIASASSTLPM
uniref:DNA repair protein recO n=1 Tax=Lygus hesperus TaxID=30085 RepID=A0A0A9XFC6_LYGHE